LPELKLSSTKPYIVRAFHEWIEDNHLTPHILVDAMQPYVKVPSQYVKDGQIVLNISSAAAYKLSISNDFLSFSARFGGAPMQVSLPLTAVLAIYARENGAGMVFSEEENQPQEYPEPSASSSFSLVNNDSPEPKTSSAPGTGKAQLTLVKDE